MDNRVYSELIERQKEYPMAGKTLKEVILSVFSKQASYTYPQSHGQRRMGRIILLLNSSCVIRKPILKCGINLLKHSFARLLKCRND